MNIVRLGIIGCGKRGRRHLRIMNDFDDVSLVAACDPVDASRQAIAKEFRIEQQFDVIEDMLDTAGLDAVLVTPPAPLNGTLALPCLERGFHALIEKPPGISVQETQGLKDAADRTGAKVLVGWNRRFHPVITQARKTILDHGPMTQLVGEFHKNINQQAASGAFSESFLDQLLLETPIHAIDTIRYLADSEVKEIHSIVRRSMSEYRDVHATLMEFENGVVAQTIHNYTAGDRLERYEIHGHDISAYMEGVSRGQVFFDGETIEITKGPVLTSGTEEQDRYFINCVKNDQPVKLPAADLGEAVKTMQLMESILSDTK